MGYTDALAITFAIAAFLAVRRGHWWWAAAAARGRRHGAARPASSSRCRWRSRRGAASSCRRPRPAWPASPRWSRRRSARPSYLVVGVARPTTTRCCRTRADVVAPARRVRQPVLDACGTRSRGGFDGRVGTALHVPWLVLFVVLVVVVFRRWPLVVRGVRRGRGRVGGHVGEPRLARALRAVRVPARARRRRPHHVAGGGADRVRGRAPVGLFAYATLAFCGLYVP